VAEKWTVVSLRRLDNGDIVVIAPAGRSQKGLFIGLLLLVSLVAFLAVIGDVNPKNFSQLRIVALGLAALVLALMVNIFAA
jgi:hypothetical protein